MTTKHEGGGRGVVRALVVGSQQQELFFAAFLRKVGCISLQSFCCLKYVNKCLEEIKLPFSLQRYPDYYHVIKNVILFYIIIPLPIFLCPSCQQTALKTFHKYECRLTHVFHQTGRNHGTNILQMVSQKQVRT